MAKNSPCKIFNLGENHKAEENHQKKPDENDEDQYFGDARRCVGNAAEAKKARDRRDDQEDDDPLQQGLFSFVPN